MLREAREIFPNTHYPPQWGLEANAEPGALPNDDPAKPQGHSVVTDGSPSVS